MKVGIILGSIREGRLGEQVANFVKQVADGRDSGVEYELIDLKSFNVPLLTSGVHPMRANKLYDSAEVTAWSLAIDACDAFVFVTAEYNHGVPGAFKNAVDSLGSEWVGKPVGFVAYGSAGGVRAIENWRTVLANFSMPNVRSEVNISIFTEFEDSTFTPTDRRETEVGHVFDEVEQLATKLAK